jgi:hypothetical protein
MQRRSSHLKSIELVARRLSSLNTSVVFTGGAIVGLLLTDPAAPDVRPTDDVDVIVGITTYVAYASLASDLRMLGFEHDLDGPNCRFIVDGLTVDIMPIDGDILGFTNRWYELAVQCPCDFLLPGGDSIRVISAPIFVATKLEAFHDRGQCDFVMSHDIEDVIAVVDGREELLEEIGASELSVRQYICDCFANFLSDRDFVDALSMHLLPDAVSQSRAGIILDRIRAIAAIY